jgi:oligopeptide transport system permease protein
MRLAPGGPFDFDKTLAPEIQANLQAKYHLDEPVYVQFGYYLKDILQGEFGPSFQYKNYSVTELIAQGFPVSLQLGLSAMLLALLLGCGAGIFAAYKQNSWFDYSVMAVAMLGISIPNFVMAPLLILVFAIMISILPAGGWNDGALQNQILPIITLALPQIAYIARISRGSMIEVLRSQFIRTAFSKGLPTFYVLTRHALKPTLLPVISYLGPAIAGLITGSVVVEQIYGIPGLGRYFVQGAMNRDYTLVMGVVVFYGIFIIFLNLIVDILYGWLDPQIRLGRKLR